MQTDHLIKRCKICGDKSTTTNYNYNGNLSCESCKVINITFDEHKSIQ